MAYEIVIPRLTMTMESAELVEWYKQAGEFASKGEALFAIETDKATQEVEAPVDGYVHQRPNLPAGLLPVGTLIGYLAAEGEQIDWEKPAAVQHVSNEDSVSQAAVIGAVNSPAPASNGERRFASPVARRRAEELGIDWRSLPGTSIEGHVILRDVERAAAQQTAPRPAAQIEISPVARRAAQDLGIDLDTLAAHFPDQRIGRADVERFAEQQANPVATAPPTTEHKPLTGVRRLIAERMAHSAHSTAAVTLTTEVDATELRRLRSQLKADASKKAIPAYTDLMAKIVSLALDEYPALNAHLDDDGLSELAQVDIGIAVDTERGLLVPVLRDVRRKSIQQIAGESAELITRARSAKLNAQEMQGSSFSISNLGMYDIDAFTPIINVPEVAILGMGRIVPKLVVGNDETAPPVIRHMLFLSLTFDHRAVDGAPAARFLQRIKQYVEQPYLWLSQ
jgi:pyruvate dehydrogenase E2 component (dihydrolipoamide acetyltransferase)